jgi:hypothetical protein
MIIPDVVNVLTPVLLATIITVVKWILERVTGKSKEGKVEEAERQAFTTVPEAVINKLDELTLNQEGLDVRTREITELIDKNGQVLALGSLFKLYSKQIERYQDETRSRASWSFYAALIAMFSGFGFVLWGGQYGLTDAKWDHIAVGSFIATIGGSISAYITKSFLSVHKLSLQQLNRYFEQPVINDHILMAQRLADNLGDPENRQRSYELIIGSVTKLIDRKGQERKEESEKQ